MLGGERVDVVPQADERTLGDGLREQGRLHGRVEASLASGANEQLYRLPARAFEQPAKVKQAYLVKL